VYIVSSDSGHINSRNTPCNEHFLMGNNRSSDNVTIHFEKIVTSLYENMDVSDMHELHKEIFPAHRKAV